MTTMTRNPGALDTVRTARKPHRCEGWLCGQIINPGTRYTRSSLPPYADVNSSARWWTMRIGPCCLPLEPTA